MDKLAKHWPALAVGAALLLTLLAAQIAIFNTEPMPAGDLESRAAALQAARDSR